MGYVNGSFGLPAELYPHVNLFCVSLSDSFCIITQSAKMSSTFLKKYEFNFSVSLRGEFCRSEGGYTIEFFGIYAILPIKTCVERGVGDGASQG